MADSNSTYDLIVIGAGPGGYVAAIRAAQLGLKTALVEKDKNLGGTCLNVGCIPSKALLHSTEMYHNLKEHGAQHGIKATGLDVDVPALMKNKDNVVDQLRGGVAHLVKKRGIDRLDGLGSLAGEGQVKVTKGKKSTTYSAKNILIATGSKIIELPFLKYDGKQIINSDHAIALDKVPKSLLVIGAGAIGLELGSVWSRLGAKVTVLEFLPKIAATYDDDVTRQAQALFKKQGMEFSLSTKVTAAKKLKTKVTLTAETKKGETKFEAEKVLVSIGRAPFTEGLGLKNVGIALDDRGRIPVDHNFQTSAKGVYAIGDVTPGPMLAHKAEEEAIACVELMAGQAGHLNYDIIPNVIYTEPELASVGIGENHAKEHQIDIKVGKFNFAANGRAIASDAAVGFAKIIACAKTDKILGAQILGRNASELISEVVTHMEYGGSAEDLARTVHAHPTLSEAVKEAALAVDKNAIHSV
jgi:dihydrolipoamide dehydrogenase